MLTSETLPEALKIFPRLALFAYAPWCPHCKELYPHIIETVKTNQIKEMKINFARIDADYNEEFREQYKVYGFPTLMYFVNGEKKDSVGGRNKDEIIEWFTKRLIGPTHLVDSINQIKNQYETTTVHKFIYFGQDKERIKKYEEYALYEDSHIFGLCSDPQIIKEYKIVPQ